ncbi:DUF1514 family protein [Staphylococcus massiliensis]|uniref:DUF1514 family protein n=1 Tax=Staphylococcus massiliensis TaxID=555791 RepID=UPI001EDD31C2|nr:DUF1514 family protein [Staphylococcus massiliensis]MCG3401702.1 DUF1514 family protein [Staphylococcus massiliensis]
MWIIITLILSVICLLLLGVNSYLSKRIKAYEHLFDELVNALDLEGVDVYERRSKTND